MELKLKVPCRGQYDTMKARSLPVQFLFVIVCIWAITFDASVAYAATPQGTKIFSKLLGGTPLPVGGALPQKIVDFQNAIGATNRRINWDGAGVTLLGNLNAKELPRDLFLGLGFNIFTSARREKAFLARESDAFSPPIIFRPLVGKNKLTITFTIDSQGTPGLAKAFGAVFVKVKQRHVQGLRYYDKHGAQILNIRCKRLPNSFQLLGAVFTKPIIAKVIIDFDKHNPGSFVDDIFFDQSATKK
jgi:hypothetical protein